METWVTCVLSRSSIDIDLWPILAHKASRKNILCLRMMHSGSGEGIGTLNFVTIPGPMTTVTAACVHRPCTNVVNSMTFFKAWHSLSPRELEGNQARESNDEPNNFPEQTRPRWKIKTLWNLSLKLFAMLEISSFQALFKALGSL